MDAKIFKSTGAIIIYSIISFGLLAIIGYNFWGWFGGGKVNVITHGSPEEEGDKCRTYHPEDAFSTYTSPPPLDGVIKNGKCVGEDGTACSMPNAPMFKMGKWKDGNCVADTSILASSVNENNPNARASSTIPVNKNWNYSKIDVWQKNQQGDTIKLSGAPIPSMFKKGDLIAVNMQSANGNQTIALNQHILDINNTQGWMIVSLYNSSIAPQWTGGYVQKV